jgi:hypothetical protein
MVISLMASLLGSNAFSVTFNAPSWLTTLSLIFTVAVLPVWVLRSAERPDLILDP